MCFAVSPRSLEASADVPAQNFDEGFLVHTLHSRCINVVRSTLRVNKGKVTVELPIVRAASMDCSVGLNNKRRISDGRRSLSYMAVVWLDLEYVYVLYKSRSHPLLRIASAALPPPVDPVRVSARTNSLSVPEWGLVWWRVRLVLFYLFYAKSNKSPLRQLVPYKIYCSAYRLIEDARHKSSASRPLFSLMSKISNLPSWYS
ncbi:hypothetical protein EVAR_9087_1 [Eumeta japonica]|uniref:Uncharacterized protein n=1 Tax=Eumeta variegata TaxID=151549 RepID=A0A4C1TW20_EUMVA|nr:hypothetical protein EVAR_9087_1 [Eumeta japonica]